jgi:hypothetical protein
MHSTGDEGGGVIIVLLSHIHPPMAHTAERWKGRDVYRIGDAKPAAR